MVFNQLLLMLSGCGGYHIELSCRQVRYQYNIDNHHYKIVMGDTSNDTILIDI